MGVSLVLVCFVYFALPILVAVWLAIVNARGHTSVRTELLFWVLTGVYVALMAVIAVGAVASVEASHGYGVLGLVLFTLPVGIVPALLAMFGGVSVLMDAGYADSTTVFFGLAAVLWSILNPIGLRWVIQRAKRRALVPPVAAN